ncbi:MAG: deoxyribodipyrimidine photo-lyase [Armatimonadota bacterium]|jgi:deoxyribodipyrimidine photo-lyase
MIQPERVQALNDGPVRGGEYVLYWMQASQREDYNHALEYTVREGNRLGAPVVVGFGLTEGFPEANERHYAFMLEGLREVEVALRGRGIQLVVRRGHPDRIAEELASDACMVVTDRGYLRVQKQWRRSLAERAPCRVVQVETDVVVPVEVTSDKEEYAARTIRPKIHKHLEGHLTPVRRTRPKRESLGMALDGVDVQDVDGLLAGLDIDRGAGRVSAFRGGTANAKRLLREFIRHRLEEYAELRNDPSVDRVSHMSPYLHFGQISPVYIALQVMRAGGPGRDTYIEELIVRRELSINFVHHNAKYDSYGAVPEWARSTLEAHRGDEREAVYRLEELEAACTDDPYWNAAQQEMLVTGKMQGYMRMYWGKKILEWVRDPEEAFGITLHLNNKYELDGRDPNSFAGVAWCFGKHDRPWGRRPVFGTVRCMTAGGLRRKFDMEGYLRKVEALV